MRNRLATWTALAALIVGPSVSGQPSDGQSESVAAQKKAWAHHQAKR